MSWKSHCYAGVPGVLLHAGRCKYPPIGVSEIKFHPEKYNSLKYQRYTKRKNCFGNCIDSNIKSDFVAFCTLRGGHIYFRWNANKSKRSFKVPSKVWLLSQPKMMSKVLQKNCEFRCQAHAGRKFFATFWCSAKEYLKSSIFLAWNNKKTGSRSAILPPG